MESMQGSVRGTIGIRSLRSGAHDPLSTAGRVTPAEAEELLRLPRDSQERGACLSHSDKSW